MECDLMLSVETFGPEHRPIVEFALDNIQMVKQRRAKLEACQQINHSDPEDLQPNDDSTVPVATPKKKIKSKKRKFKDNDESLKTSGTNEGDEIDVKIIKGAVNDGDRAVKKNKNPAKEKQKDKRKRLNNPFESGKPDDELFKAESTVSKAHISKSSEELNTLPKRRKVADDIAVQEGKIQKQKTRSKDPSEQGIVDKLDMLVEQYRAKFSQHTQDTTGGQNQCSRQLKRWFNS